MVDEAREDRYRIRVDRLATLVFKPGALAHVLGRAREVQHAWIATEADAAAYVAEMMLGEGCVQEAIAHCVGLPPQSVSVEDDEGWDHAHDLLHRMVGVKQTPSTVVAW
jgi:hypothetical protein